MWGVFLSPAGLCLDMFLTMRLNTSDGHKFGNRPIPEYLGDRSQSEDVRVPVVLFSLLLCFYLAGQLVSGVVMFELLLSLPPIWALLIITTVLLIYVVLGGAHADISADGQACLMLLLAGCGRIGWNWVLGIGREPSHPGWISSEPVQLPKPFTPGGPLSRW